MLGDDLSHDGQSQARAPLLGGEIGEEEILVVFRGDPGSIVFEFHHHRTSRLIVTAANSDLAAALDFDQGVKGVVDQIDEDPLDLDRVPAYGLDSGVEVGAHPDALQGPVVAGEGQFDEFGRIDLHGMADGKTCETGKLLDQGLERGRLCGDQSRRFRQCLAELAGLACPGQGFLDPVEAVPDAIGRELDGGQRVLDLVSQSSGDLLPGGEFLSSDQFREVVQDDQVLDSILERQVGGGHGDGERQLSQAPLEVDPSPVRAEQAHAVFHVPKIGVDIRLQNAGHGPVQDLLGTRTEHFHGRLVGGANHVVSVHAHHPGGDVFENRLDIPAAFIQTLVGFPQLGVGLLQPAAAVVDLVGHPVEGVHQDPQLVHRRLLHPVVQVPFGKFPRTLGQGLQRNRDSSGHVGAQPDENDHHDQGGDRQDQVVAVLELFPVAHQLQMLFRCGLDFQGAEPDAFRQGEAGHDPPQNRSIRTAGRNRSQTSVHEPAAVLVGLIGDRVILPAFQDFIEGRFPGSFRPVAFPESDRPVSIHEHQTVETQFSHPAQQRGIDGEAGPVDLRGEGTRCDHAHRLFPFVVLGGNDLGRFQQPL